MFCKTLFISVLQFVFDDMFHLPQHFLAAWRLPVPPFEPCAVCPDEGVQLAAADTLVAVSYTHLDVYKRQVVPWPETDGS